MEREVFRLPTDYQLPELLTRVVDKLDCGCERVFETFTNGDRRSFTPCAEHVRDFCMALGSEWIADELEKR